MGKGVLVEKPGHGADGMPPRGQSRQMRQGQVLVRHLGHLDDSRGDGDPRALSGPEAGTLDKLLTGCPGQTAEGKAVRKRMRVHLGEALGLRGGARGEELGRGPTRRL